MQRIALTGGICSGKTMASRFFKRAGIHIIDADLKAREVITWERTKSKILDRFGAEVFLHSGDVDRQKLGALIFSSAQMRRSLDEIMLPAIWELCLDELQDCVSHNKPVLLDAALLFEGPSKDAVDKVVVVLCSPETQVQRLMQRNGLSVEEAKLRIASQCSNFTRVQQSDYILWNTDTPETLENQCKNLMFLW